jgi:hypothetical protein
MRGLIIYRLTIAVFIICIAGNTNAQSGPCTVLVKELSGTYNGECRKGLANGNGEAIGTERYIGTFKNGYPNGKGEYYYSNGAVYKGSFLKGKRHGEGILIYTADGDTVKENGIWENDNYIGKKTEAPYEITLKRNVLRYSIAKTTDSRNMVMIKVIQNGSVIYPDNMMVSGSSGIESQRIGFTGYDQIQFPFYGTVKYSLLQPFHNNYIDYEFNYIIRKPGSWEVTLNN